MSNTFALSASNYFVLPDIDAITKCTNRWIVFIFYHIGQLSSSAYS